MSGAPPVEDLRETAVGPSSSTADSSSPGRLACSLQSLRGKLSRASVRSSGGDSSSSSITRAVQPTSTRPPRATSHVHTVKQSQPPAASSPTKSAATTTGAANGGDPAAPLARAESASSVVGDGASAGAPPATGGARDGVSSAPVAARGGDRSEGWGGGGACGAGESQDSGRKSGGAETQNNKGGEAETKGGIDGGGEKAGGSSGAQFILSAEGDSKTSADRPPDKPHVCGSFFSPCCAKRAGSGVTTFSSRTSAASSSGCSSLGSLSVTGRYSTKSSGDSGPSSLNSSLKSSTGSASSGVASRGSNISSNETDISSVEAVKSPTSGTTSGSGRSTSRYKTVGSGEGSSPSTSRHRSPVSLARILARPVFASPSSEATSGSPPSRPTAPARKKSSSVVYFHPEFHPQVIEEDDQGSNTQRSQMPSRSMGNSSSTSLASPTPRSPTFRPRVTLPPDYEYMKKLVPELKMEIKDKDHRIAQLEVELNEARRSIQKKDNEISKLHREIHKMQSVLAASPALSNGDLAGKLHGAHLTAPHTKKQGVSGESSQVDVSNLSGTAPKFDKDFRSKQLIKEAIMDNDFLKKLDSSQLREIVESMYPKQYAKGTHLIREGEVGSHLFVSAEGQMEVIKDGQVLGQMGPGKAFGELAILYNCTRTASVKAVTAVQVWELERRVFQAVMMRTAIRRLEDNLSFLRSVPLLATLSREKLVKMADVIETEHFTPGSYIIREGTSGDTFYIISAGAVKVTQRVNGGEEDEIRTLKTGEFFGEQALLREDKRTANIIALPPSVTVLALDRTLDIIATLGIGGFGRVELVQNVNSRGQTLALKCLKKHYIVETQQQEHVHSEKEIMLMCNHQFIVRLYKTFRDTKYVYLLMDACLGGEVWSILRDRGQFDTDTCRFYTACVVEALEYLHKRNIVYRDLKPENLLLDTEGFCKLTDFGFSKELRNHGKTWTFCGTPEYVSPEVILNKGHDRAVDYWSLGVLMFELYTGAPPFTASDPMKTYNIILKGIEIIDFPRHIPRAGEQLIKRLCRDIPTERLGYQRNGVDDIRKHKWFQGFDWEGLRARALAPPIVPQVKGPTDASNFDCYTRDLETPPDELSGWDEDF